MQRRSGRLVATAAGGRKTGAESSQYFGSPVLGQALRDSNRGCTSQLYHSGSSTRTTFISAPFALRSRRKLSSSAFARDSQNSPLSSDKPQSQRTDKCELIKRVRCPSSTQFKEEFYDKQEAVVITDALKDWPALSRWQDKSYLKTTGPEELVPVRVHFFNYCLITF